MKHCQLGSVFRKRLVLTYIPTSESNNMVGQAADTKSRAGMQVPGSRRWRTGADLSFEACRGYGELAVDEGKMERRHPTEVK